MSTTTSVEQVILEYAGAQKEELFENALLEEDLGITGDDACELMEALVEEFKIDLSGFELEKHFLPEVGKSSDAEYGYYPVSVGHLLKVVRSGRWELPPRNQEYFVRFQRELKRQRMIRAAIFVLCGVGALVWFIPRGL